MMRAARIVAATTMLAACGGHGSSLPYLRTATMTPEWLTDREATGDSMHRVAQFKLADQHGATVSEQSLKSKVTIVQFFFTTCGDVCPATTSNLARLLRESGGDSRVQVLSYSVTPERDSVGALRAYAAEHGITDSRWRLLTGPRADIERLARESYFVLLGDGATYGVSTIAHTESVLLVDGCGRLRGVYAGTLRLEMQRLREDAAVLAAENCSPARS